jgi:hypothetical protein
MKKLIFLFTVFLSCTGNGQVIKKDKLLLTISPNINKTDPVNKKIIQVLTDFLNTKNTSLAENKNWIDSDFKKYVYPYFDIYNIEKSKYGENFYQPTLTEIISTENENQKIVKISFIGHRSKTNENLLKSVYNIIANIKQDKILFSSYLDYSTKNWETIDIVKSNLKYKISSNKKVNEGEILNQQNDIEKICNFFQCKPIAITYYSCINPKEIYNIKGFDYHPMMYVDKTGGIAEIGNIIFSGNNSEIYTHEIIHIYTNQLFPKIDKFIDEGLATFIAGSGKFNYEWHRNKFAKFLNENKGYNFANLTNIYERIYFENETSIPYLFSALIVERILRIYGKEKLIEFLKSEKGLWKNLNTVGLTKENINKEIRKQIKMPVIYIL